MKNKILILLAALTLMMAFTACGEKGEDDPEWKKRDVTVNMPLLQHVWDVQDNKAESLITTTHTLVFHRQASTADITLLPPTNLSGAIKLNDLKLDVDKETGRYNYKSATTTDSKVTDFSLSIDFNEQSMFLTYTLNGRYHVTSQQPSVYFLGNLSTVVYRSGAETKDNASIYQFDVDVLSMTATMRMGPLTVPKLYNNGIVFNTVIVRNLPLTMTEQGFELKSEAPETVSLNNRDKEADARDSKGYQKYPVTSFSAVIGLRQGTHSTSFKLGREDEKTIISVSANGTTYSESSVK